MISLNAFFDHVAPQTPGCPNPTVRSAVRQAAIEFCERTHVWLETLDPLPIDPAVSDYEVEAPLPDTRVVAIYSMRCQGALLFAHTEHALDQQQPDWRAATGQPRGFVQANPATLRLVPQPAEAADPGLTDIRAALAPTQTAAVVGDVLYEEYAEAIGYGALERLLRIPGQAWSQPELSAYYRGLFALTKSQARVRARQGFGVATTTVRPARLAGAP